MIKTFMGEDGETDWRADSSEKIKNCTIRIWIILLIFLDLLLDIHIKFDALTFVL